MKIEMVLDALVEDGEVVVRLTADDGKECVVSFADNPSTWAGVLQNLSDLIVRVNVPFANLPGPILVIV